MKRFATTFVVFFILLPVTVSGQSLFQSDQDFSLFINNYYSSPKPENIVPSIEYYIQSQYYNANQTMMAHFYSTLFKQNNSLLEKIFTNHSQDSSDKAKIFILRILNEMNTPQSIEFLVKASKEWTEDSIQNALKKIKQSRHYDVLANPPRSTADLDRLWGSFYATGNDKAVHQVISVLYLWEEGHGTEVTIGGAAKWSLANNAIHHRKVLEIIKNEMENASGSKRKLLKEIADTIESKMKKK